MTAADSQASIGETNCLTTRHTAGGIWLLQTPKLAQVRPFWNELLSSFYPCARLIRIGQPPVTPQRLKIEAKQALIVSYLLIIYDTAVSAAHSNPNKPQTPAG